jgi:hypothetical protein
MIGRRTVVGLSLLSALLLCAFAAQGAHAAWEAATNTTAFTCAPGGGSLDFTDAHCDSQVTPGTGSFGHVALGTYVTTTIQASNTNTKNETKEAEPVVLEATVLLNKVTVTCKKAEPDGTLPHIENKEPIGTHQVEGTIAVNFTECSQTGNGKSCQVFEPTTFVADVHGAEEPVTEGMALEFRPHLGLSAFAVLQFTGSCLIGETNVTGAIRATGSGATGGGATLEFKPEDEELTAFGSKATLEAKLTTKMTGGNPISLTTVT